MSNERTEQWAAQYGESWSDRLRGLAQNDYMIDQHFLPEGDMLIDAAAHIEALVTKLMQMTKRIPDPDDLRWFLSMVEGSGMLSEQELNMARRLRAALEAEG